MKGSQGRDSGQESKTLGEEEAYHEGKSGQELRAET